jgi:hypothetical protein
MWALNSGSKIVSHFLMAGSDEGLGRDFLQMFGQIRISLWSVSSDHCVGLNESKRSLRIAF